MGVKIEEIITENGLKIINTIRYDDQQGFVYFILSPKMKMIKIGWAKNDIQKRMSYLQTGSADKLEIINYFSGTRKDERKTHKMFSEYHSHLEWYFESDEIYNFLDKYYSDYKP